MIFRHTPALAAQVQVSRPESPGFKLVSTPALVSGASVRARERRPTQPAFHNSNETHPSELCLFDRKRLLADAVFPSFGEHLADKLLRHIDQGMLLFDENLAEGIPGNIGMVGNRANNV